MKRVSKSSIWTKFAAQTAMDLRISLYLKLPSLMLDKNVLPVLSIWKILQIHGGRKTE